MNSTLAYQVYGKKVDINFINNIHKKILGNLKPNLVFVLKVSEKSSRKRLKKRKTKNRYDNFANPFTLKLKDLLLRLQKIKKLFYFRIFI